VSVARNGDLEIAYETFGSSGGRPLLLIQGAGAPMWGRPEDFCTELVERGFHVARFDNRDAGRSSRAEQAYTLGEMALDGFAVLDALGWSGAHVVVVSLGGMIGQVMAVHHPDRVLSLTSMCSAPDHFMRWDRRKISTLLRYAAISWRKPAGPRAAGEHVVKLFRIIGSPGYAHDEDWIRQVGSQAYQYRTDFDAGRRQAAATRASGDRRAELSRVQAPTLVLSGEADAVQPARAKRPPPTPSRERDSSAIREWATTYRASYGPRSSPKSTPSPLPRRRRRTSTNSRSSRSSARILDRLTGEERLPGRFSTPWQTATRS
jgi:pimeloyl-ACP methyl ester carboxylesterase